MKVLFSKLYVAWVLFVFSFFMILYLPGIILPFLFGERYGTISYQFLKLWSWTFSKLNFIHYDITGKENIKKHHAYIYVSNHTSYLDIPGMCLTVPTQIRPLAKKELKKVPIFGWIVSRAAIIVDRSSNESRRKSMDHLKDVLKKGISILIFPEGTQNRSKELLAPFYDGAFRIAIETQQPIMPMVIHNAGNLMPPTEFVIRPGTIRIEVLPEIPTTGLTTQDVPALKEKVIALMISKLQCK
ncbi:MAG TPA: lysophospholipid acyltransferase family protein [Cyclobacteriaceae bacterium]|nr:lysophospholipid acyltransferase family protein [Cyclobacteriaceae bacterium]